MTYRVLVTGSRDWADAHAVGSALLAIANEVGLENMVVVHGKCPRGADYYADIWAEFHGTGPERHPADWGKHGRAAGIIRNVEMVDAGADVCLAFFKEGAANIGTKHCADLAERAGIEVRRFRG